MSEALTVTHDVRTVTAEIKLIINQTLNAYIEIGRRLKILKEMLPHGEFGDYVKREFDFSRSTSANMIQWAAGMFPEVSPRRYSLGAGKALHAPRGGAAVPGNRRRA
ncbi:hypothetical protein FACS18949_14690 [Clostridia bacterium]|nr:hypothetical protein FACS189425_03060 [Clostridia bacterium]GHV35881.1 hypothetical protein FACS18949_14690 [Clostridia bacterium]